jgi:hypothetical protein
MLHKWMSKLLTFFNIINHKDKAKKIIVNNMNNIKLRGEIQLDPNLDLLALIIEDLMLILLKLQLKTFLGKVIHISP